MFKNRMWLGYGAVYLNHILPLSPPFHPPPSPRAPRTEQPDVGKRVDECFANVKALLAAVAAKGVAVTTNTLTAKELSLPAFGSEWIAAVGAYRLARFARAGYTAPNVAEKIDRAITSAWPVKPFHMQCFYMPSF